MGEQTRPSGGRRPLLIPVLAPASSLLPSQRESPDRASVAQIASFTDRDSGETRRSRSRERGPTASQQHYDGDDIANSLVREAFKDLDNEISRCFPREAADLCKRVDALQRSNDNIKALDIKSKTLMMVAYRRQYVFQRALPTHAAITYTMNMTYKLRLRSPEARRYLTHVDWYS